MSTGAGGFLESRSSKVHRVACCFFYGFDLILSWLIWRNVLYERSVGLLNMQEAGVKAPTFFSVFPLAITVKLAQSRNRTAIDGSFFLSKFPDIRW